MKIKCFLFLLSILFILNSQAKAQRKNEYGLWQNYKGDTSRYLYQNFVEIKANYIGSPLSSIFKRTEIPIKCCVAPTTHLCEDTANEVCPGGNHISLLFSNNVKDRHKFTLRVVFEPLTNVDSQIVLLRKRRSLYEWTKEEETYYAKFIVKDIEFYSNN